jgi:threonine/homoserine/homoserine lactone efflux protein
MIERESHLLFLTAATLIAVTPGPGIFYVAARTLAGGRREGLASSFGTGLGGLVHVVAGAVGVSALVMASAEAFAIMKIVGAAYLVWLGVKTIRTARLDAYAAVGSAGARRAFREGIMVEALNPKTAAFFLGFIPQFIDQAQPVAPQFIMLGLISVVLNTAADVVVTYGCARVQSSLEARPGLIRRIREGAGVLMCGLGLSLLLARKSA